MPLTTGSRLGPYEILSAIGAGGMGEVYRAKDPRLNRDVAIKVLPATFSADADRLRRFELEAKSAGALNHPNITAVLDIGQHDGEPYVVQELLEGESLRDVLKSTRLPTRKAIDYSLQIAHGLAAAHEKGIVHRDLKPENIFITRDGRAKILDFGLAKLTQVEAQGVETNVPTQTAGTEPGMVMGTAGYMSPEQVRGVPVDARSDIFSFGAILYEMLSGKRAFQGDSAADTMLSVLKDEPPELSVTNHTIPPGVERVVHHCLEKNPEQRFHSAHDLAFDLETLSGLSAPSSASLVAPPVPARSKGWLVAAAGLAAALVLAAASFFAGRRVGTAGGPPTMTFTPLTYRSFPIFRALFAPDGRTVVFSAATAGNTPEIFTLAPDYPDPRRIDVPDAQLLSVSSKGELALLTRARYIHHRLFIGTLSRMPLSGGAPREILEGVREADWAPDGETLAVIRELDGKDRLEFPIGKVLYTSGGYLSDVRVSPKGDRIAFLEHPFQWDDRGSVEVVDLAGKKTVLSGGHWGIEGLAWSRNGREVFFSAGTGYSSFDVHAVTLAGKSRIALAGAGGLTIFDISHEGRWLAARQDIKWRIFGSTPGDQAERDLSWLDGSSASALSADGRSLLFSEYSGAFGRNYSVCFRGTDGSPVVRLGEGWACDLSPDGRWALSVIPTSPDKLMLYPTGPGEARHLESGEVLEYSSGQWFPDGKRILVCGSGAKETSRCYVQDTAGGKPKPVTSEGARRGFVSPDGAQLLVQGAHDEYQIYPSAGGEPRAVTALTPQDIVYRWTADGKGVLATRWSDVPANLERVDLEGGPRTPIRRLAPSDLSGVVRIYAAAIAGDGKSVVYTMMQRRSDLFLVEGAR